MTEILRFLINHCSFLYAPDRYRFVDSGASTSFGDAFLVLASEVMRLRFVRDRGQMFLDFQGIKQQGNVDWFSIDIVRRLITGEKQETAELSIEQATFLHDHLSEIEKRFHVDNFAKTVAALRDLERIRAKELFG